MSIRLIIADHQTLAREGLKSLLKDRKEVQVVAETNNGRDAVRLVKRHSPDVAILEAGLPELNGLEATRRIAAESPETRILALSANPDQRTVARMLKAGAHGFLPKNSPTSEVLMAVRSITKGDFYLSAKVVGVVIQDYILKAAVDNPPLTSREIEILQLLTEGKSSKEVAYLLNISDKTVNTHRINIMNKLDLHSIAELTKYALREGLTSLEH